MKSYLFFLTVMAGVVGSAQASEKSTLVAWCSFNEDTYCMAEARICLNQDLVESDNCQQALTILCDDNYVFHGTWTPGYNERTKELVINADSKRHHRYPPKILITPRNEHENNPATLLFWDNTTLQGSCYLSFNNVELEEESDYEQSIR